MINVSKAFRQAVAENREYLVDVDIELRDGIHLDIGEMDPEDREVADGGLSIDDAVSSDNNFDIGATIINKCTLTLNNMYDDFSEYDFTDARVVPYVGLGLPDGTVERVRKGTFTVDDAKYNGSIITLTCLDNMARFDRPYSLSSLVYPATLGAIVRDACDRCGVPLQTYGFPHSDHVVEERPDDEATTFREIISWAAQIACCFCRCDVYGRLELKWYDQEALEIPALDGGTMRPWTEGEVVDGGSFSPWTGGEIMDGGTFGDRDGLHHIYALFSMDISVDDVVITGVRVSEETEIDGADAVVTYQSGTDGYVVSIEGNDLIQGGAGQQIAAWIGEQLIGFRFRRASVSHLSDPTMEAGDVGYLSDRKGNTYRIVISSTKFSVGATQSTSSSAQTPARNSATRFSADTKNYVENRKHIEKERTDREEALEALKVRIDESPGLFTTEELRPDGGSVFYLHDKPLLEDSKIIWIMTTDAWGVSTDGGKTLNAGMTVDGDLIARILTVIGVNADWINAGAFKIEKNGKPIVLMDKDTKQVILRPDVFELSSGKTVEEVAKDEADKKNKTFTSTPVPPYKVGDIWMDSSTSDIMTCINARSSGPYVSSDWQKRNKYIDQAAANTAATSAAEASWSAKTNIDIFNKLTKNGTVQGISTDSAGNIYVNATYINSGAMSADHIRGGTIALIGSSSDIQMTSNRISFNKNNEEYGYIQTEPFSKNTSGINFSSDYGRVVFYVNSSSRGQAKLYYEVLEVLSYEAHKNRYGSSGSYYAVRMDKAPVYIYKAYVDSELTVKGTKNRVVTTADYADRLLYCYEMSSPMFGDIGEAVTDENGECYIYLDDIFSETVSAEIEYQVFLQKEGAGDIWVEEKNQIYFLVKGTEDLKFAWEIKAKQKGYKYERMETYETDEGLDTIDYGSGYEAEVDELIREREELLYETT